MNVNIKYLKDESGNTISPVTSVDSIFSGQNTLKSYIQSIIKENNPYPIGSIYMNISEVSPSTLFGGTWERLKDRFLLAVGDTYKANTTGGNASQKLTTSELPSHTHTFTGTSTKTDTGGAHEHNGLNVDGALVSVVNGQSGTGYGFGNATGLYNTGNGISTNTTGSNHSHTFTAKGTNSSTGSGSSFSIMPPYQTVYVWKRTA